MDLPQLWVPVAAGDSRLSVLLFVRVQLQLHCSHLFEVLFICLNIIVWVLMFRRDCRQSIRLGGGKDKASKKCS